MLSQMETLPRGLAGRLIKAVEQFPVTVLEGGRAVGKSTLCRIVATQRGWPPIIDLTLPDIMGQLRLDPLRFLRGLPSPVIIDEAQLEPKLPLWVKLIVDEQSGRPGQFILTGSARLGREQLGGSDPLAGRAIRLRMWPLTATERNGEPQNSTARLFNPSLFRVGSSTAKADSARPDWLRGGLPGLPGILTFASDSDWNAALASYVEATIPLGLTTSRVDHSRLLRVFRYLAANPGQILNLARAASELSMKADTVRSYIETLEASFLLFRAEAQRPAEHRVLTAHPRIFATDVGLSSWALGLGAKDPTPVQFGSLLENHLAVNLAATSEWSAERILLRHWRDERSKREVDLLVVHPDGRMVAVEVKAASTVGPRDTQGLIAFALSHREQFSGGYIAYEGTRVVDLSPPELQAGSILGVPSALLLGA